MRKVARLSSIAKAQTLPRQHTAVPTGLCPCRASAKAQAYPTFCRPAFRRHFSSSSASLVTPIDGQSYARGPTEPPLDERTLGQFLDHLARDYGQSPALVVRHEQQTVHDLDHDHIEHGADCLRYTFSELKQQAESLARGLLQQGFKKGDRIAVYAGNSSSYALLQWATAKASLILVCLNPAFAGPELMASMKAIGAKMLVLPPSLRGKSNLDLMHSVIPNLKQTGPLDVQSDECPELKRIAFTDNTALGAEGFTKLLEENSMAGADFRQLFDRTAGATGVPGEESASNHDVINIQQTSGTTGLPKGVALTHRNLLNNGHLIGDCMDLQRPKSGGKTEILINQETFDPAKGLLAAVEEKAVCTFPRLSVRYLLTKSYKTALHGVPTMFIAQLALVKAHAEGKPHSALAKLEELDFSSLRTGIAAGSPVPPKVMERLIEEMNLHSLVIQYGQTESSPVTIGSRTSDSVQRRIDTVGRVLPHTVIRIVDPAHPDYPSESVPNVPVGQPGELWSGGYAIMKEYWENPSETQKAVFVAQDGMKFLRTGDQAVMDDDGYVKIIGRIKDIIIRGGENLFPVVIENRTLQLPGVADVSIVSVPDPKYQEAVGAFVQRHDSQLGRALTPEDIHNHVKDTLSHQSAPEWVWFLGEGEGVPTEYPKTASGKIRKVELRDIAKELSSRGSGKVSKRSKKG